MKSVVDGSITLEVRVKQFHKLVIECAAFTLRVCVETHFEKCIAQCRSFESQNSRIHRWCVFFLQGLQHLENMLYVS